MAEQTASPDPSNLGRQASDAFASGKVAAGIGIAGLVALLAGIGLGEAADTADTTDALVVAVGLALLVFSGAVHLLRGKIQADFTLAYVAAHQGITASFIAKVNDGTVNAQDVVKLVDAQMAQVKVLFE